jgi:hypothetical protein
MLAPWAVPARASTAVAVAAGLKLPWPAAGTLGSPVTASQVNHCKATAVLGHCLAAAATGVTAVPQL